MTRRPRPDSVAAPTMDNWRKESVIRTAALMGPMASDDFDKKFWRRAEVVALLRSIFRGVCGYCESPFAAGYAGVEHYRPKSQLRGDPHTGYYWLAYNDSNYRLTCTPCNTNKGSKFPIARTGTRAQTSADDLALESPLLLDPCGIPDPDGHFVFSEDGKIRGRTEAGRRTVRELNLNRDDLMKQRKEAWLSFCDSINLAIATGDAKRVRLPKVPTYLAVRRAVVRDLRRKSAVPQFFDELYLLLAWL